MKRKILSFVLTLFAAAFFLSSMFLDSKKQYVVKGTSGFVMYVDEFGQERPIKLLQTIDEDTYVIIGRLGEELLSKDKPGFIMLEYDGQKINLGPYVEGKIKNLLD